MLMQDYRVKKYLDKGGHTVSNGGGYAISFNPGIKAIYRKGNSTNQGFLVIKLPVKEATVTMMNFRMNAYVYETDKSFTVSFGGYNYYSPKWFHTFANKITNVAPKYNKIKFVRFLKDGGNENKNADYNHFGFIIGRDENINWIYPAIEIDKVQLSHQGLDIDKWDKSWDMQIQKEADITKYKIDREISFRKEN
jgi:hypothetical protein